MNQAERVEWVDIYKGLCIISVVIGHSGTDSSIFTYIYLFHMAAFFIISGYTYSGRKRVFFQYIKSKILNILLPFFVINTLFIVFYQFIQQLGYGATFGVAEMSIIQRIKGLYSLYPVCPELGGPTWFLLAIFEAECICRIIQEICCFFKVEKLYMFFGCLVGVWGYFLSINCHYLPFTLDLGMLASGFLSLGIIVKEYSLLLKIPPELGLMLFGSAEVFFGSFYFYNSNPANWPTRQFPKLYVFVIISISGSYLIYRISKAIESNFQLKNIFACIGRYSLTVLMYHFVAFRVIHIFLITVGEAEVSILQNSPPMGTPEWAWIIYTLGAVVICVSLGRISKKCKVLDLIINGKLRIR